MSNVNFLEIMTDGPSGVPPVITTMASLVEGMVDNAIDALLGGNAGLAAGILHKETAANAMEMQIDQTLQAALANGTLERRQIREAVAMLKINKDLERMADLAANIARNLPHRPQPKPDSGSDYSDLQPLAIAVSHLTRKTLRALARRDLLLATSAKSERSRVDTYRNYVLNQMSKEPGSPQLNLLLASRYLEQIAEQATNIARNLIFWLERSESGIQAEARVAV
jgi:phosphate transport system protein